MVPIGNDRHLTLIRWRLKFIAFGCALCLHNIILIWGEQASCIHFIHGFMEAKLHSSCGIILLWSIPLPFYPMNAHVISSIHNVECVLHTSNWCEWFKCIHKICAIVFGFECILCHSLFIILVSFTIWLAFVFHIISFKFNLRVRRRPIDYNLYNGTGESLTDENFVIVTIFSWTNKKMHRKGQHGHWYTKLRRSGGKCEFKYSKV